MQRVVNGSQTHQEVWELDDASNIHEIDVDTVSIQVYPSALIGTHRSKDSARFFCVYKHISSFHSVFVLNSN